MGWFWKCKGIGRVFRQRSEEGKQEERKSQLSSPNRLERFAGRSQSSPPAIGPVDKGQVLEVGIQLISEPVLVLPSQRARMSEDVFMVPYLRRNIYAAVNIYSIVRDGKLAGRNLSLHRHMNHGRKSEIVTSRSVVKLFHGSSIPCQESMTHRAYSSSSSSNPLLWDPSSATEPILGNTNYQHRGNTGNGSSGDVIRWATSIGISLAVFTLVLNNNTSFQLQPYLSEAAKRVHDFCRTLVRELYGSVLRSGGDSPAPSSSSRPASTGEARRMVPNLYSYPPVEPLHNSATEDDDFRIAKHKGSCHCAAVAFHIVAPRTLQVQEGSGKIPYPRTLVPAKNFQLRQGQEALQTYYVGTSTSAHTFCRQCGVHLLYAPNPHSKSVYLNVDLLQPGWKRRIIPSTDDDDEEEVRMHDQFPESRSRRSHNRSSEEPVASEPFGNITTHATNAHKATRHQSRRFSLDIVTEEPPSRVPSRELTPVSNSRNPQQAQHLFSESAVVAIAREASHSREEWRRRQTVGAAVTPPVHDFDDDISEPTIPPDLISAAGDAASVGDCSARSYLTEATAKSLRRYMAKHLRSSSHQSNSTTTAATSTTDSIPYDHNENNDEEVYPSYFR